MQIKQTLLLKAKLKFSPKERRVLAKKLKPACGTGRIRGWYHG